MTAAVFHPGMNDTPHDPARVPAAVLAVTVHVLLFVVLFFGVRWSSKAPDAVVVELWNPAPLTEPVPAPEKVEPPQKVEPAPPKPIPKVQIKPEPRPVPVVKKPDIAVEKEKPKPKPTPVPNLKFDMSARIKEEMAQELAKSSPRTETAKPAAPAPSAPVIDNAYAGRIRAQIRGYIVEPSGIVGNPEAIFDVIQIPTGEVIYVKLRKSSGVRAYDEAVERAIRKSSPLPLPSGAQEQFQRQLELKFKPKDPL